jgi:hypothetical protein
VGSILVVVAALAVGVVLARRLYEMRVPWTPMHRRYAVVALALLAWALLTIPSWAGSPTAPATRFGAPGATHLLVLGVVGFVVAGTLYHVVPFIVWAHRYSDLLGFEDVPMIDDLYDDRLAAVDLTLLLGGTVLLVAGDWFGLPDVFFGVAGALVTLGASVFVVNLLLVVHRHSPVPIHRVLIGSVGPSAGSTATGTDGEEESTPAADGGL